MRGYPMKISNGKLIKIHVSINMYVNFVIVYCVNRNNLSKHKGTSNTF